MTSAKALLQTMTDGHDLVDEVLVLGLDGQTIAVQSNSSTLISRLRDYFAHVVTEQSADITVTAIERPVMDPGLGFTDWTREPGKSGRKDAYIDLDQARAILKVRTGMVFLQSADHRVAAGPCLANDNQVINYINAQYMNRLQNQGDVICHASALVSGAHGLAIAGLSGGGKSTLMLRLMDEPGCRFLTNDRLFLRDEVGVIMARGIPKLPRINPGTLLNNPKLQGILPVSRQQELAALSRDDLWDIEEKYDVDIAAIYGPDALVQAAPLTGLLVLNWDRSSPDQPNLQPVRLADRDDILGAVMKSPGPFYQLADGSFLPDGRPLDPEPYRQRLQSLPVFEMSGGIDFDAAALLIKNDLLGGV